jgi:glutamine amidotransferase
MCRHVAYLGEPVSLRSALVDPPHGLVVQAWAPRRQRHGVVNADGFGVGWYADGDPVPARYRQAGPIWADSCFTDLARVITTRALLAAVRSATAGTDPGASAAAPYAHGRWLFSHNGALAGWSAATGSATPQPAGTGAGPLAANAAGAGAALRLAAALPAADLLGLTARCDSALVWAMVLGRLRAGAGLADALTRTLGDLSAAGASGRFNLLLTDGESVAATAAGDTLCFRREPAGVIVASEPCDDGPGWQDVPDGSVLTATPRTVSVRPLALADVVAAR